MERNSKMNDDITTLNEGGGNEQIGDAELDVPTTEKHVSTKEGVYVEVNSKRGEGTRDEDRVKAKAHYDDEDEASEKSSQLTDIVKTRMREIRGMGTDGCPRNTDDELGDFND